MRPDETLVKLVTWIGLIEDENSKLLAYAKQMQEKDKLSEATIKALREAASKLPTSSLSEE